MEKFIPKTKREIALFCDKIIAEQKVARLRMENQVLKEVLKEKSWLVFSRKK